MTNFALWLTIALVCCPINLSADERTWKDRTRHFQLEAALVGFDGQTAILKKSDGEMVAFAIDDLSEEDRKYLESEAAEAIYHNEADQTWTFANAKQVQGHVVTHFRRDVTLQYRRGKVYVNDRPFDKLPDVYKLILPHFVNHFEKTQLTDEKEFKRWVMKLKGKPVRYSTEGVILALEDGDEYGFPYFLFADEDRKFLELGRKEFQADSSEEERARQALYMQAMAREYQQERRLDRQIQMMQTELLAVNAGLVDIWEVFLIPPGGNIYQARTVLVPARTSLEAQQAALRRWPGFVLGPVRRVNRNR